jgi:hypothetical protein
LDLDSIGAKFWQWRSKAQIHPKEKFYLILGADGFIGLSIFLLASDALDLHALARDFRLVRLNLLLLLLAADFLPL